jgi:hypothetical protein
MWKTLKVPATVLALLAGTASIAYSQSTPTLGGGTLGAGGNTSSTRVTGGSAITTPAVIEERRQRGPKGTPPGVAQRRGRSGTPRSGTSEAIESGAGPGIHGGDPRQVGPGVR